MAANKSFNDGDSSFDSFYGGPISQKHFLRGNLPFSEEESAPAFVSWDNSDKTPEKTHEEGDGNCKKLDCSHVSSTFLYKCVKILIPHKCDSRNRCLRTVHTPLP